MAISDKIKALLAVNGAKGVDVAAYMGMTPQSWHNKLSRGSFSAADLIKLSDYFNCSLTFVGNNQSISFDIGDLPKTNLEEGQMP